MSVVRCDRCEKLEDTDYEIGEWINDKYICEDCMANMEEDELEDLREKGR